MTDGARNRTQKSSAVWPVSPTTFPGWIVILIVSKTSACIKEQIVNQLQFSALLFCHKYWFRSKEEEQKDLLSNIPHAI